MPDSHALHRKPIKECFLLDRTAHRFAKARKDEEAVSRRDERDVPFL